MAEVTGQLRPLTPCRRKISDRVPQIPCPVQPRSAYLRRSCQQRSDDRPFLVGAVACVAQPSSVMLATSGFGPAHVISVVFATPGESQLAEIAQLHSRPGSKRAKVSTVDILEKLLFGLVNGNHDSDEEEILIDKIDNICTDPNWLHFINNSNDYLDETGQIRSREMAMDMLSHKPISMPDMSGKGN